MANHCRSRSLRVKGEMSRHPRLRFWGRVADLPQCSKTTRGKRFALWSFLHMFGSAPDLDVAFENEEDREAARDFMDLMGHRKAMG